MSAVLKEEKQKDLAVVLIIPETVPADFYTNKQYDSDIDAAIEQTKNLVYPLDDAGEKQAKADATAINKFATAFDKFTAATYKAQTETVGAWRDGKKEKIRLLLANRQQLLDQFAEKRQQKLDGIKAMLEALIVSHRAEIGVKPEFYATHDLSPMIKLSGSLTPGGKLTDKASGFARTCANGELNRQERTEKRIMLIDNRCLKADINPPLSAVHFGSVMQADDEIFNAKLEELVSAEVQRRAEIVERIKKQQERENQAVLDAALKEQQEAARIEAEANAKSKQAEANPPVKTEPVQEIKRPEPTPEPVKAPRPTAETRTVKVIAEFEFNGIRPTVSDDAVLKHFIGMLPEMPDKLKNAMKISVSSNE